MNKHNTPKLLLFVPSLCSGGAERVASIWSKGFADRDYNVSVVLNCDEEIYPRVYDLPVNIETYNIFNYRKNKIVSYILRIIRLSKIVKKIEPDVIISVLHPNFFFLKLATGFSKKYKFINTEHNAFEWPKRGIADYVNYYLKFHFNKLADVVTVLTQADKDYIGGRLNNVTVLPNPLSFTPLNYIPHKKKQLLAVGRINSWYIKGFDVLINAWGQISEYYPDWTLKLIGNGSFDNINRLIELSHKNNISNIVFEPFQKNIVEAYRESSIFVLSSRTEGFGMVLIEAMSQGCACISTDYKGRQSEILGDSEFGIICNPDDVEDLAKGIKRLIEDDGLMNEYQNRALTRSANYSIKHIMDNWEHILSDMFTIL